jgi:hypothetical protein
MSIRNVILALFLTAILTGVTACGITGDSRGGEEVDPVTGKAEAWNHHNSPSRFSALGLTFIRNYDELHAGEVQRHNMDGTQRVDENGEPVMVSLNVGESEIKPWPASYWPMQKDGYNYRWRGKEVLSPMEKYDKVYNGWEPPEGFMELRPFTYPSDEFDKEYYEKLGPAASWAHMNGGNRDAVEHVPDPEDPEDDPWGGLESWFGHCHAWAPAAISEEEPLKAVEVDGMRFEVADIKALVMAQYEGMGSVFLGGRCNDKEVERDEHGRIKDGGGGWFSPATACRDTNPGAFHVITVNMLGRYGRSFVVDVSYGYQVWNHPVLSYEITHQEKFDDPQRALSLLPGSPTGEGYLYNDKAVSFVHVKMTFKYITESSQSTEPMTPNLSMYTNTKRYEYLLELDESGNIVGGEWISNGNFPDFLWAPIGHGTVANVDYDKVMDLLAKSRASE